MTDSKYIKFAFGSYKKTGDVSIFKRFDFVVFARVGDISALRLFGFAVFEQMGDISVLFGIDWRQKNANYTS